MLDEDVNGIWSEKDWNSVWSQDATNQSYTIDWKGEIFGCQSGNSVMDKPFAGHSRENEDLGLILALPNSQVGFLFVQV